MKTRSLLLPLLLLVFSTALRAQLSVGRVTDEGTGAPVAGATIYVNNTLAVTQTDAAGYFRLQGLAPGTALMITHVSYQKSTAHTRASDTLRVALARRDDQLATLTVKTRNKDSYRKWGAFFREYFIGRDEAARQCRLLNPEVLSFRYNEESRRLLVRARGTLLFENRLLGLIQHVDLDQFLFSFSDGTFYYSSSGYYEPIQTSDATEKLKYAAGRLLAWRGSRTHFLRALQQGELSAEGFHLYGFKATPNYERLRVESILLQARARDNREAKGTVDENDYSLGAFIADSARYYKTVMTKPPYLFEDSLHLDLPSRWTTRGGDRGFRMPDSLLLQYDAGRLEALAQQRISKALRWTANNATEAFSLLQNKATNSRYSLLYLKGDSLLCLTPGGLVVNKEALVTEGYLGELRTAFELPIDYDPAADLALLTGRMPEAPVTAETRATTRIDSAFREIAGRPQTTQLYLHLDKTIYDQGENIWFAAYVLQSPFDTTRHRTLFASLMDSAGKKVTDARFVLTQGLGSGYLFVADSLPAGRYQLVAFTNTLVREQGAEPFRQQVVVRALPDAPDPRAKPKMPAPQPVAPKKPVIAYLRFYPEGGDLVNGLGSTLAYEARDSSGRPLRVTAQLIENGKPIARLQTSGTGFGSLPFVPQAGAGYRIEPVPDTLQLAPVHFPAVRPQGQVLHIDNAVATDSVRVVIRNTQAGQPSFLMLHDYRNTYLSMKLEPAAEQTRLLPLRALPPGPATLTLFDADGNPVAERTIYHEPAAMAQLEIHTDTIAYGTRKKVQVRIRARGADGVPDGAVFSLACVRQSSLDSTRFQSIVPFAAWQRYGSLQGWAARQPLFSLGSAPLREELLLTRCWTRYRWDSLRRTPVPSPLPYDLAQKGTVLLGGKKPVAAELMVDGANGIRPLATGPDGRFVLGDSDELTQPDWLLSVFVNRKDKQNYLVRFSSDRDTVIAQLARRPLPPVLATGVWTAPEEKGNQRSKMLANVTIQRFKPPVNARDRVRSNGRVSASCPDYVCMYNILNCINHHYGIKPQVGNAYVYRTPAEHSLMYYNGCGDFSEMPPLPPGASIKDDYPQFYRIAGKSWTKEFYVTDFEKEQASEPELHTTLFWNPLVQTNEKGEATLSFFTNDLEGAFLIHAMGVSGSVPLQGKARIEVRK